MQPQIILPNSIVQWMSPYTITQSESLLMITPSSFLEFIIWFVIFLLHMSRWFVGALKMVYGFIITTIIVECYLDT